MANGIAAFATNLKRNQQSNEIEAASQENAFISMRNQRDWRHGSIVNGEKAININNVMTHNVKNDA